MTTERISLFKKINFKFRIAFLYLRIGLLWILLSDTIANNLIDDKKLLGIVMYY
jgi:hypothetical protein